MGKNKTNRGRPELYTVKVLPRMEEIKEWARAGATYSEMAAALGIAASTFSKYVDSQIELKRVVSDGQMSGVPAVKMALYKRAIGYEYEEKKVSVRRDDDGVERRYTEITTKHVAPDVSAIGMYLRNCGENWMDRDKFTVEMKEEELKLRRMLVEAQSF